MDAPRYYSRLGHTFSTQGGNLPHWSQSCATFVTFRLADSLPAEKRTRLSAERDAWLMQHPRPWSEAEECEYSELFDNRLNQWLDAGYGACLLKDQALREVVESSLRHFADKRYALYSYVVMPNHVHALFMPHEELDGRKIVADWKRFTAKEINRMCGSEGAVWQKESYDRLVRDVEEFNGIRAYIRGNNPTLAFDAYEAGATTASSAMV